MTERRKTLEERGLTRLTFDVRTTDADTLEKVAAQLGYNKVTTMVRALRVLSTLVDAEAAGATVTISNPDGTKDRLLLT